MNNMKIDKLLDIDELNEDQWQEYVTNEDIQDHMRRYRLSHIVMGVHGTLEENPPFEEMKVLKKLLCDSVHDYLTKISHNEVLDFCLRSKLSVSFGDDSLDHVWLKINTLPLTEIYQVWAITDNYLRPQTESYWPKPMR